MDPNIWFNISRFATIIGGLLTVIGGFGLYHFGKIKELNVREANKRLDGKVQSAKAEAASANMKVKELELDVVEATKETEIAKQKAEEFRLAIQETNLEAQNANLKTEELTLEVEKTKLEAEKAKLERDKIKDKLNYIKSIYAIVTYKIPIKPVKDFNRGTRTHLPEKSERPIISIVPSTFSKTHPNKVSSVAFEFNNWTHGLINKDVKAVTLRFEKPSFPKRIYGRRLDFLKSYRVVHTFDFCILKKYQKEHDSSRKIEFMFELFVNGVKVIRSSRFESEPGEFFKNNRNHIYKDEFQKIPEILLD